MARCFTAVLALSFVAILTLPTARAAAQEQTAALPSPLRADDVLAWTRAHRPEITAARAKAGAAAQVPKVVSALPDPMVMASLDHLPFNLMGVDASLMVQQEFPLSGVLGKKADAAQADAKAQAADVARVALDVELEAVVAYLMLVEREWMADVLREQIGTAKQIVEATLARLEGGSGSAADVVRARLDVARLEGELKAVEAEIAAARGMLNAALARPVDASVPRTAFVAPLVEPPPLPKLVATAIDRRPELVVLRHQADKAQAQVGVMDAMYKPMAFVRAGGATAMPMGPGVMLMVGVSVPIWREKLSAGVSEAKQMASMVDAETAAMRKMIEGQVATARGAVVASRIRYDTAHDKLVPIAKQALALTLPAYATGQMPLVSVLESLQTLRMAQMESVVTEVRLAVAWARLGRTTGVVRVGWPP